VYIVYVQCMCEVYDANTLSSTMHAAEYPGHVGCDAVLLGMLFPMLPRIALPSKHWKLCSCGHSVNFNSQQNHSENIKSHKIIQVGWMCRKVFGLLRDAELWRWNTLNS